MTDIYSPRKRSEIMSRIRSTGTTPEQVLYEAACKLVKRRFKVVQHPSEIAGRPDVYVPYLKLVLFADGCFFHGCPIHGHIPKSNSDYWFAKIRRNRIRDERTRAGLRKNGYSVWRFWEHELKPSRIDKAICRLERAFCLAEFRYRK